MIGAVWKRFFLTLGIFLLIGMQGYAKDLQRKEYTELDFDEELTWSEPKVHNFRLENGIHFYIVEDHELPLVNVQVMVRSGEFLVPEGKQGLAEMTAEVMRSGGSEKYPAESLNRLLANKAANINMSFGFSSGSASMDILKEDFEELLPVFVDLLHKPKFPSEKIDLAKQKLMTDISRRNDQQAEIAFRIFKKMIYGQDHVYARVPEYSTVKGISRSDLQSFHEKAYQGANMLVGIIGDIDPDKIKSLLKKEFSVFAKGNEQEIKVPAVNYKYKKGLNLVDKPDVNQSFILMGHIGGKRQNPDYAKLQVLNKILSGGFSGRLFE
jgi:predicted Zn-dependent peptidase